MWHSALMADGAPDDGPSLEMPSLSLRRRKEPAEVPDAPPRPRQGRSRPHLLSVPVSGLPAAAVTGVAVGGLAVLLAWLAGVGCEVVRGTSSCGGGPGLLLLVVVLALLALAGSVLLRQLGVPHPGSTSVLAVGILAVLVLVFLLDSLGEGWALVAVPLASAAAFCASWWVTTAAGDDD